MEILAGFQELLEGAAKELKKSTLSCKSRLTQFGNIIETSIFFVLYTQQEKICSKATIKTMSGHMGQSIQE